MTVIRNKKRKNPFVQIDKKMLSDEQISWKAKGILSYLLSKPDDWITYISDLEKRSTDGRDSVRSGFKELENAGYISKKRLRVNGQFKGWEYEVYERPYGIYTEDGKTEVGKTNVGKTDIGESNTSNNDLSNNELTNIKPLSDSKISDCAVAEDRFEEWWNLYGNKKGRKKCHTKYKSLLKQYTHELMMAGTETYLQHLSDLQRRGEFVPLQKNPLTFLNGEHFNDEYEKTIIPAEERKVKEFSLDLAKGEDW